MEQVRLCKGNNAKPQIFSVRRIRPIYEAYLLLLKGIEDRNAAETLAGAVLEIQEHCLPPLQANEFYLYELRGSAVSDNNGNTLGKVQRCFCHQGQDLIEIQTPDGQSILYPLKEQTTISFCRETRSLIVRHIEGLFDPPAY